MEILNVARRLFSEHGYHATGVADIQAATGLTKGAFYHHFSSKEEVGLAVLDLAEKDYAERMFGPAMEGDTSVAKALAVLDGGVRLNSEPEWCNCRLMATLSTEMTLSEERLRERVQAMHERMFALWVDLLQGCRAEGALREGMTPEHGAQLIVSAIMGVMVARKLGHASFSISELVQTLKQSVFNNDVTASIQE